MELRYANRELERRCTDSKHMQRKLGPQTAKALKRRIAELRRVAEIDDLLLSVGRWEKMKADRQGEWSARLSANWRLIVRPEPHESGTVLVVDIEDYH